MTAHSDAVAIGALREELKPCPFCGGPGTELLGGIFVGCEPCALARRDANSWNRRSPVPSPSMEALREAAGHLGAALVQSLHSDDQIIVGHIREAKDLIDKALKETKS